MLVTWSCRILFFVILFLHDVWNVPGDPRESFAGYLGDDGSFADGEIPSFHEAEAPRRTSSEILDVHVPRQRHGLGLDGNRRDAPSRRPLLQNPVFRSVLQLGPPGTVASETAPGLLHAAQVAFLFPPVPYHGLVDVEQARRRSVPVFRRVVHGLEFEVGVVGVSPGRRRSGVLGQTLEQAGVSAVNKTKRLHSHKMKPAFIHKN